jgi:hypothetical protein
MTTWMVTAVEIQVRRTGLLSSYRAALHATMRVTLKLYIWGQLLLLTFDLISLLTDKTIPSLYVSNASNASS